MTETAKTTATPKSAAKAKAGAAPEFEIPNSLREFAERSLDQTRDAYGKFRDAMQDTASVIEQSTTKAADTTTDMNLKAIDFAKSQLDASFDLTRKLLKTRDLSEAVELQVEFARKQVESYNAQAKDMTEFASKAAQDVAEPLKAHMNKSMEQFRGVLPS